MRDSKYSVWPIKVPSNIVWSERTFTTHAPPYWELFCLHVEKFCVCHSPPPWNFCWLSVGEVWVHLFFGTALRIPRWWMFDRDWLIREVILIVNCKCLTHTVFWLLYFVVHQRVVSLCFQSYTILLIQPNTKPESRTYSDYQTKDECMEGNTDYKVGLTGLWD